MTLIQLKKCYVKVVPCYHHNAHPQVTLVEENFQIQTGAANIVSLFYRQLMFANSCWCVYHINIVHSADCPHMVECSRKWQTIAVQ